MLNFSIHPLMEWQITTVRAGLVQQNLSAYQQRDLDHQLPVAEPLTELIRLYRKVFSLIPAGLPTRFVEAHLLFKF